MSTPPRMLPNFIIIGGRRCGTRSLYCYLKDHPNIASPLKKEVHFFDTKFDKGANWYKAHFPSIIYKNYFEKTNTKKLLTFEATPYFLSHPLSPKRIAKLIPKVKLIVLLRNPIDRAFSDWKHLGTETFSFNDAIQKENERLEGEEEKLISNPNYISIPHWRMAFKYQGLYNKFLKNWFKHFSQEQFLIIKSEDFFQNPESIMKQIYEFLELEPHKLQKYEQYNATDEAQKMDPIIRKKLEKFFEPHNKILYEMLSTNFEWN